MARAEVDHRLLGQRKVFDTETLFAFVGEVRAGAEQPAEVPQNALAIALDRNHPLHPALDGTFGIVIAQAIKQAGLQFLGYRQLGHVKSMMRQSSRGCSPLSGGRGRWPRQMNVSWGSSCHSVLRVRRRAPSGAPSVVTYRLGTWPEASPPLDQTNWAGAQTRSRKSEGAVTTMRRMRQKGTQ